MKNKILLSCIILICMVGCKNHKTPESEYVPPTPAQVEPQAVVAPEPEVQEEPTIYTVKCSTGQWVVDTEIELENGCAKFTVNEKTVYVCGNFSIEER